MLHWFELFTVLPNYLLYCQGEVFWFVPSLSLSQLCQPDHKKQFIEKLLSNSEYGISKTKDKFLNTKVIIFFFNSKTRCTSFNPLMSGGRKRSNILKKTYSQKLLSILSMCDLLLPPGMRILKGGTDKEKSLCEFLILALFKETLICN